MMTNRRLLIAAGATLATALAGGKLLAAAPGGSFATLRPPSGEPLPEIKIGLPGGGTKTLADYAGRGVVLNLWATWCAPCVAEMPALDELARLVAPGVAVLPLSSDRGAAAAVEKFYAARGIKHLPVLLDPMGAAGRALGVRGIPTTVLIDAKGVEQGRIDGAVDWAGKDAVAAIRKLGPPV